jgi:RimJ/RimL family protein N-acetyltransferase
MPTIPDLQQRLGDDLIELRAIAEWDIPEILIAHQDDPDLYRRLGLLRPPTGAQLGSEVEHAEAQRLAGNSFKLTIVEAGGEDCRGRIDVHSIDWVAGTAQLGVWVAPQVRRRGFGTRALQLTSAWLFQTTELRRLALATQPDNEALLAAAAAAGFALDATVPGGELVLLTRSA